MGVKFVRIKEGMMEEVEEVVTRRCKTASFLENMRGTIGFSSGRLPKDCIIVEKGVWGSIFIVQISPRKLNLKYMKRAPDNASLVSETYNLSMPFIQHYFRLNAQEAIVDVRISCTTVSAELDTPIFVLPVGNQYESGSGKMCTGGMRVDMTMPLHKKLDRLIVEFWDSNFNDDLGVPFPESLRWKEEGGLEIPPSYFSWQKHTEKNPLCGLQFKYNPHAQRTIGTYVKNLIQGTAR